MGSKIAIFFVVIVILIVALVTMMLPFFKKEESIPKYNISGKNVLLVVFDGFQPKEYYPIKRILKENGANVKVLAVNENPVGADGNPIDSYDFLIKDVDANKLVEDFDAIVIIGGPGVYVRVVGEKEEPNMDKVYELIRKFNEKGKLVAAICASPAILAKAGILNGKKATVWSSPFDDTLIRILEKNGAKYIDQKVVVDGNIITANGPQAAEEFAEEIVKYLSKH